MASPDVYLANELIRIQEAFAYIDHDVSPYSKNYCPWGHLWHSDGGASKAMRIYEESNSAWCFACGERFRPVDVFSRSHDVDIETAAQLILEYVGYVRPDYGSRWDAVTNETELIDRDALTEALRYACKRMSSDWEDRQFDDRIAGKFQQCLELLAKVKTSADADRWLETTKLVMSTVLET